MGLWPVRAIQGGVYPPPAPTLGGRAFTLIELLIVIVVVGLLIAAIFLVASSIHRSQKIKQTETIMRSVTMALEQFATENPLRNIYDRKDAQTFGPYPAYQLEGANVPNSVASTLEPGNAFAKLEDRLYRDLRGTQTTAKNFWVNIPTSDANDDIRALYTYLKVYSPGTLDQVPPSAIKPLKPGTPEYVNPKGAGTTPPVDGLIDVLGIYDAWGVPLDYFLYVKLEWAVLPNVPPPNNIGWRVTDRVPVLRSRGISLDEYQAELGGADPLGPEKWIFSEPFRSPPAAPSNGNFKKDGKLPTPPTPPLGSQNGWARALGAGDLDTTGDQSTWFGYVP